MRWVGDGLLALEALASLPGVAHAFETRRGDLGALLPAPPARLRQVHGCTVVRVARGGLEPFLEADREQRPEGDALITDRAGIALAVSVADCLPVLVADPVRPAVAAIHCGWRGLAAGVVEAALEAMARAFGTDPSRCLAGVGPGIGPCCYEVGEEVREALSAAGLEAAAFGGGPAEAAAETAGARAAARCLCDLVAATAAALRRAGMDPGRISAAGLCTCCSPHLFHSYRRDGDAAGRMLAGIALL